MLSNIATEYKLNSPEDWDDWQNELLNRARANDLLPILQGTKRPIKKPMQLKERVRTLLNQPKPPRLKIQLMIALNKGQEMTSIYISITTKWSSVSGRFSVETSTKSLNG
ncbi:hypothetical protein TSTA_001270 [Talaromyces stipitatus ATCC 10500]|uniref:Uncharacterized protein n=1 Tax=Talaromyces stipitatus (strain ATCC 10500 / CBS 375.48 / QM 6759 / NRRL 1006) TaxID=441959 RepID=B8MS11_TALSN|nr:uncharacterized protein TSTA_001270 [Talaromyces stipitatus ATCC 10500]EED12056.1 hypothetical protein TSTA_001270 [Talaromyces stipitatus ATCC 10500]